MSYPSEVTAVRLYGPSDMRVEQIPHPGPPGAGNVLLRITTVGVCGSDLHTYKDARIGDDVVQSPSILGHEFAAVVEEVGPDAVDGLEQPLSPGMRVAVDPAEPCWRCEMCEQGHPNLCLRLLFHGTYPGQGSLVQWMLMPVRNCFPLSDSLDDTGGAMLEPLGIAIHTVDLARIKVAQSVAIIGAGCIGLLILQLAKLSGAEPIFISDKFPWRLALAEKYGAIPINCDELDQAQEVLKVTNGRGVDVAIEAAWADHSVQAAADMLCYGGRMVIAGISEDDRLTMQHSTVRRKGLDIRLVRRMKNTYPRALRLAESGLVDLHSMISHRFPLEKTSEAYDLNLDYQDNVIKIMIDV